MHGCYKRLFIFYLSELLRDCWPLLICTTRVIFCGGMLSASQKIYVVKFQQMSEVIQFVRDETNDLKRDNRS